MKLSKIANRRGEGGWREGHSSVVRTSELKSEDPGFNPLAGQGEKRFFYRSESESTLAQTSLRLATLRVYSIHPYVCAR